MENNGIVCRASWRLESSINANFTRYIYGDFGLTWFEKIYATLFFPFEAELLFPNIPTYFVF